MSGLFAAAFLRQIGWDADVYERSAVELVGRGAGITTHPELLQALEGSGATTHGRSRKPAKALSLVFMVIFHLQSERWSRRRR